MTFWNLTHTTVRVIGRKKNDVSCSFPATAWLFFLVTCGGLSCLFVSFLVHIVFHNWAAFCHFITSTTLLLW